MKEGKNESGSGPVGSWQEQTVVGPFGCWEPSVGKTEAELRFISALCNKTKLQREKKQEDKQTLVEFQANEAAFARP
jgi:hypothetical protein